jgi:hypothetical protein
MLYHSATPASPRAPSFYYAGYYAGSRAGGGGGAPPVAT